MTTQLFHNIKRLLKTVKHNINETKGLKRPDIIKIGEVSELYNLELWNKLSESEKNKIISWWENEWNETVYESHQEFRYIPEELFIKFFTAENYML